MDKGGYSNISKFLSSSADLAKLIGKNITHTKFGVGTIININKRNISIKFKNSERLFPFDYLQNENVFSDLDISDLEDHFAAKEQEKLAIQDFDNLKEKYHASSYKKTSPLDFLYIILKKIDNNNNLDKDEINFLTKARLFKTLIIYSENRYTNNKDPWDLINVAKYCRKDDDPSKAIEITDYLLKNYKNQDKRLDSSILTTRGGAFRDILDLVTAEACARSAIQYSESYHPYNLLGAIYFQNGDFEGGVEYFERALELGSEEKAQEYFMKSALSTDGPNKTEIAIRLYKLDPKKYRWSKEYFSDSEYKEYMFKDVIIDV